jgi:hypothetical protein
MKKLLSIFATVLIATNVICMEQSFQKNKSEYQITIPDAEKEINNLKESFEKKALTSEEKRNLEYNFYKLKAMLLQDALKDQELKEKKLEKIIENNIDETIKNIKQQSLALEIIDRNDNLIKKQKKEIEKYKEQNIELENYKKEIEILKKKTAENVLTTIQQNTDYIKEEVDQLAKKLEFNTNGQQKELLTRQGFMRDNIKDMGDDITDLKDDLYDLMKHLGVKIRSAKKRSDKRPTSSLEPSNKKRKLDDKKDLEKVLDENKKLEEDKKEN